MRVEWNTPFSEMVKFFISRGYAISEDSWRDVWKFANARAFTVAQVTAMDVLETINAELERYMVEGLSLAEFKKNVVPRLETAGWFAPEKPAKIQLPDGSIRKRLTGGRLDNIARTNYRTAHSAGRYKQQTEAGLPYLQYRITPRPNNRPPHKLQDGKTFRADHAYWDIWYTPNGFG